MKEKQNHNPDKAKTENVEPVQVDAISSSEHHRLAAQIVRAVMLFLEEQDLPVGVLVPKGTAETVKQVDFRQISFQDISDLLPGVETETIEQAAIYWSQNLSKLQIVEAEIPHLMVLTITTHVLHQVAAYFEKKGLSQVLEQMGVSYQEIAGSQFNKLFMVLLLALETHHRMSGRNKIMVPAGINIAQAID